MASTQAGSASARADHSGPSAQPGFWSGIGAKRHRFHATRESAAAAFDDEDDADDLEDGGYGAGVQGLRAPPVSPVHEHPRAFGSMSTAAGARRRAPSVPSPNAQAGRAQPHDIRPPPRKRAHYDLEHEDVGRFASMSLQNAAVSQGPSAPPSAGLGLGLDPPPPPVVPPSSPERPQAPVHNLDLHLNLMQQGSSSQFPTSVTSPSSSTHSASSAAQELSSSSSFARPPHSAASSATTASSADPAHSEPGTNAALKPSSVSEPADSGSGIGEVSMRERDGPKSWEYAKDRIWVESLDSSSSSERGSDAGDVAPDSFSFPTDGSSTPPESASFILNPELTRKLEEEAKRRLLAAQQAQAQAQASAERPPLSKKPSSGGGARSFFRKPRLFQSLSYSHGGSPATTNPSSAATSARSSRSSSGSVTPAQLQDGHALILWRSPEEVRQSNHIHMLSTGTAQSAAATTPASTQPGAPLPNLLDFGAASLALVQQSKAREAALASAAPGETQTTPVMDADALWDPAARTPQQDAMDVD